MNCDYTLYYLSNSDIRHALYHSMNTPFEKNLISTKEASQLSGYNPDYLARLCRSGKISGTRVGRAWLVS